MELNARLLPDAGFVSSAQAAESVVQAAACPVASAVAAAGVVGPTASGWRRIVLLEQMHGSLRHSSRAAYQSSLHFLASAIKDL